MSFGKSFGFSILAFIGLNVAFTLIGYLVLGILDLYFASLAIDPSGILILLFGPLMMGMGPGAILGSIDTYILAEAMPSAGTVILWVGFIVAPALAAFLSGWFGENKKEAFLGWFLTAMICSIVILILGLIFAAGAPFAIIASFIVTTIFLGVIFGIFYGCVSLLTTREF